MTFAEVSVNSPIPTRSTYTYEIPPGLNVVPGHGVYVPFGPRILQGIVFEITAEPRFAEHRPLDSLVDQRVLVSPERLELARWIAERYLSPLFSAVALMLPPGFERKPLTIIEPGARFSDLDGALEQQAIIDEVRVRGRVELDDLKKTLGLKRNTPVQSLIAMDVLARVYQLDRPAVGPKTQTCVELLIAPEEARARASSGAGKPSPRADILDRLADGGVLPLVEARSIGSLAVINKLASGGAAALRDSTLQLLVSAAEAREQAAALRQTARQRQEAAALRFLSRASEPVPFSVLRAHSEISRVTLDGLAQQGLVSVEDVAVERDPLAGRNFTPRTAPMLTPEQQECTDRVIDAVRSGVSERFLLHGVTGSGKTEIYLKALEETVAQGRRGIALVPEISLTPQTVRRFAERFPGRVAVLHSGLSQGELHDQWQGIRDGRYDVVVGARSATFAPQPDLGLIVVDEQHEWTYKQTDIQPHYDARAAAARLAELSGAVLLEGSATPSVEAFRSALEGESTLLTLEQRVTPTDGGSRAAPAPLPLVEVVDMRAELRAANRSIFSRALQQGIRGAIAGREQIILFMNRRGSAGFLLCRACSFVPRCPSCGLTYSYHRAEEKLVCHGCNRRRRPYESCPSCGGPYLRPMGAGTQRVEDDVGALFPGTRVMRWDRDVTSGKDAHERILNRFLDGDADILVGTQMLAKGLDIPAVTLVGVVNADIGLNLPDFRAAERSFQLMAQVAGRTGRGGQGGRVIIQTYLPQHPAIIAAAEHDYRAFYDNEIEQRRKLRYPPFRRLVRMTYAHTNEQAALREADRLAGELRTEVRRQGIPATEIIGPAPAYFSKLRGRYRWDILVKGREPERLVDGLRLAQGWVVDVDPVSMS